jgi:hypothetical protein
MNFTLSNNMSNYRYNINYTVTHSIADKMLKARMQSLRYDLTILMNSKHIPTLS